MFNKENKETNYWMSYADILTGLAVIFIIISITLGAKLNKSVGKIKSLESKLQADSIQMSQIKILESTFKDIEKQSDLFNFDEESQMFKLDINMEFPSLDEEIPTENKIQLIQAGTDLKEFIEKLHDSIPDVEFAVIIEGRTAKFLNKGSENEKYNKDYTDQNKTRSYNRAYNLFKLWKKSNESNISNLEYCDVLVVGNGFDGKGRYPYKPLLEEKNKNFVVKIIPKLKPINR